MAMDTLSSQSSVISSEMVLKAAILVNKALQVNLNPSKDKDYKELLAIYRNERALRDAVDAILQGLDLKLLDVSEKGIIIAPASVSSKFAFRLSDFRSTMTEAEKAALVVAHMAIASLFYPTTDSLDDDEHVPTPVSVTQCRDNLIAVAAHLKVKTEDVDGQLEMVRPGWALIINLPISIPNSQKASMSSIAGLVKITLNNLVDGGLVNPYLKSQDDEGADLYTATHRYRVQLRELTLRTVLACAMQARNQSDQTSPSLA